MLKILFCVLKNYKFFKGMTEICLSELKMILTELFMKKIFLLIAVFVLAQNVFSQGKIRNYSETTAFIKNLDSNFTVKELDTVEYKNT